MSNEHWYVFHNDYLLLLKNGDQLQLPTHITISQIKEHLINVHNLGQFEEISYYCAEISSESFLPNHIEVTPLRKAFEILGHAQYPLVTKASSVLNWDKNHRYCGRCGSKTKMSMKPHAFEKVCENCGLSFYPRISPSIIVLIKKDDHVLLARSPRYPKGSYGLIAGFVEIGESIEDAIHREVYEEIGIKVHHLQYFGSQPWPFPDSLMIGFFADYLSGEINIDHDEIESAGWYRYNQLPGYPSKMSIAKKLLDYFVAEQTK